MILPGIEVYSSPESPANKLMSVDPSRFNYAATLDVVDGFFRRRSLVERRGLLAKRGTKLNAMANLGCFQIDQDIDVVLAIRVDAVDLVKYGVPVHRRVEEADIDDVVEVAVPGLSFWRRLYVCSADDPICHDSPTLQSQLSR